jgi:hypothetical protein
MFSSCGLVGGEERDVGRMITMMTMLLQRWQLAEREREEREIERERDRDHQPRSFLPCRPLLAYTRTYQEGRRWLVGQLKINRKKQNCENCCSLLGSRRDLPNWWQSLGNPFHSLFVLASHARFCYFFFSIMAVVRRRPRPSSELHELLLLLPLVVRSARHVLFGNMFPLYFLGENNRAIDPLWSREHRTGAERKYKTNICCYLQQQPCLPPPPHNICSAAHASVHRTISNLPRFDEPCSDTGLYMYVRARKKAKEGPRILISCYYIPSVINSHFMENINVLCGAHKKRCRVHFLKPSV